jgi:hypothetical protein
MASISLVSVCVLITLTLVTLFLITMKKFSDKERGSDIFYVTRGTKTVDSPFYNIGNSCGFFIDGESGKTLYLHRGRSYKFVIKAESKAIMCESSLPESFYFTLSPVGGPNDNTDQMIDLPGLAVSEGILIVTITETLPTVFYYQSKNSLNYGGMIIIVD